MSFRGRPWPRSVSGTLGIGAVALIASVVLSACGNNPSATSTTTPSQSGAGHAAPSTTPTQADVVTIKSAAVAGLGSVLVNSHGRTLYTLGSESAGKLTCTVASGCTQSWFETVLPSGSTAVIATGGAQSSMLGSEPGATGTVVTYHGWPLYTFSGDNAANQANGEGLQSFGGTWYVMSASGAPVTPASAAGSPSPSPSGYGY